MRAESPLAGKVAFITGAGRGQGRSHAVTLARAGADIVATDVCADLDSLAYPLASKADLEETARLVEAEDRRCVTAVADVRDAFALDAAVQAGMDQLGRLDIVLANAGVLHVGRPEPDLATAMASWKDAVDVMLTGVFATLKVTADRLVAQGEGGAIVLTSSVAGLKGMTDGSGGLSGYNAAKHGVVGLMRGFAQLLGPHHVRVNSVHPTAVRTEMVTNPAVVAALQRPDTEGTTQPRRVLPVMAIEPGDVSKAILWLVSDDAAYVTGVTLPVDAGVTVA